MGTIEWIGVLTGIAAVYLLYLNHILTWPVGFISIGCFMWLCWHEKLYGDFVVQIIFLVVGIWGWIHWKQNETKRPGRLTAAKRWIWVLATLISIPFTAYYFKNHTDCSYPLAEAAILNISLFGQLLTSLRKIENWYFWLVVDPIMMIVYALKGLYPFSAYALIIFVIGIFGLLHWRKMIGART